MSNEEDDERLLEWLKSSTGRNVRGTQPSPLWMPSRRPSRRRTAQEEADALGLNLQISTRRARPRAQYRTQNRPDRIPPAVEMILSYLPRLHRDEARELAKQWVERGFDDVQIRIWADALGIRGYQQAALCNERGLNAALLPIRLNGISLARRIRGGEDIDAVLAQASALGIQLVA